MKEIKFLKVEVAEDGKVYYKSRFGSVVMRDVIVFGIDLMTKEQVANLGEIYVRNDGSNILVKDMDSNHLLYAMAKVIRRTESGLPEASGNLEALRNEIKKRLDK